MKNIVRTIHCPRQKKTGGKVEELTMEEFLRKIAGKKIKVREVKAAPPAIVIESHGSLYKVKVK